MAVTSDNGNTKNQIKNFIVIGILALMVLGYFFVVANRMEPNEDTQVKVSAVKGLLSQNLQATYPKTPKEVVKMYCEISRCFYAEEYTDDELEKLAYMSRELFDHELRANQTDEDYLRALRAEIANFKSQNKIISSYSAGSSADVEYYNFRGDEWAQLVVQYNLRIGTGFQGSIQRFLLRKDADGHWKIYGWEPEETVTKE